MNGKRIFGAAAIALGTFVGAGTLAKWTNEAQLGTEQLTTTANSVVDTAEKSTDQLADVAKNGASTIAEKLKNAKQVAEVALKSAEAKVSGLVGTAQSAAASVGPSFVELKLNAGEDQYLAGRAQAGSTVEALVDGKAIGTAVAAKTGAWKIPLATPVAEKAYTLSLRTKSPDATTSVLGQTADVIVDADGRAQITIKPAPVTAEVNADTAKIAAVAPSQSETNAQQDEAQPTPTKSAETDQEKSDTETGETNDSKVEPASDSDPADPTSTSKSDGTNQIAENTGATDTKKSTASEKAQNQDGDASNASEQTTNTTKLAQDNTTTGAPTPASTSETNTSEKAPNETADTEPAKLAETPPSASDTQTAAETNAVSETGKPDAVEEPGLLDGLIDQASKMAEAATEKFSDVLGTGGAKDTKPSLTVPLDFDLTNVARSESGDTILEVAGTGKPGFDIGVLIDGNRVATTRPSDDGTWSVKQAVPLKNVPVELKVAQFDASGNIIGSQTRTVQPRKIAEKPTTGQTTDVAAVDSKKSTDTDTSAAAAPEGNITKSTNSQSNKQSESASEADSAQPETGNAKSATSSKSRAKTAARTRRNLAARAKRRALRAKRLRQRRAAAARTARNKSIARKSASRSPYIRNRRKGPWAGTRVTRLNRGFQSSHRSLRPAHRIARHRASRARHIRRLKK